MFEWVTGGLLLNHPFVPTPRLGAEPFEVFDGHGTVGFFARKKPFFLPLISSRAGRRMSTAPRPEGEKESVQNGQKNGPAVQT